MKQSGLRNRFSEAVRNAWLYWYACMVCHMNRWDALHHIISPSSRFYIDGDHNESALNSCPIHNHKCHVGNEGFLYSDQTIKLLLRRTFWALMELGYQLTERDRRFVTIYAHLYDDDIINQAGVSRPSDKKNKIMDSEMTLKKYKVLGEIFPLNEDGSQQENALEVGSIQEVPEEVGKGWVENGLAEEVVEDSADEDEGAEDDEEEGEE